MVKSTLHIALLTVMMLVMVLAVAVPTIIISPQPVYATVDTFYSSIKDGDNLCVSVPGVNYTTVRNAASASLNWEYATTLYTGQSRIEFDDDESTYCIMRSYLFFDTTDIPDNAIISSAILRLYGERLHNTGDYDTEMPFYLRITEGMPTYPHDPLVNADWNRANYETTNLGQIHTDSWTNTGYNNLPLTAAGLAAITKTGTTKFCVRSSRDIAGSSPSLSFLPDEYLAYYSADKTGTNYDPKLEITYTVPATQVAVTTQDADAIGETGARLRGQVTEDGGDPAGCTVWFRYGLTDSYGLWTDNQEGFGEGSEFSDFVSGLQRGQLYHFKAYAANTETAGNGTDKTFFTFPAEPSSLTATPGNEHINLAWTKGDGAQKTMIRYLTSGNYPQSPTDGTQAYFDTGSSYNHTSLDNDTTYTYSAWSYATEGGLDEYSGAYDIAFATPRADAVPTIVTYDASDVEETSATLHGYLSNLGGYSSTMVSFQWYEDGGTWTDHETSPQTYYAPNLFEWDIYNLDDDTLYYFRARGENSAGNSTGASKSFTTGAIVISAPSMTTQDATTIGRTSATIHGKVSDWGGAYVTAWFEWGTSTDSYDYTSTTQGRLVTNSTLTLPLDSLELDTTYYYRVVGDNDSGGGGGTGYGADMNFTTSAPNAPTVITQAATGVGADSATLQGFLVSDGSEACEAQFQWYAENETVWEHETGWQPDKISGDPFDSYIADLDIGKTYYYRAQAQNGGGIASGSTRSFLIEFGAPADFVATAISSYAIKLTWTPKGEQTYIVMKPTGYAANRTDGTMIYSGSSNTYVQMELDAGETYYYRGWSWTTSGNFSDEYASDLATTLAPGIGEQDPSPVVTAPDKPSRWDASPDPSAMNGTIFYNAIETMANAIEIPLGIFWLLLAVLFSMIMGMAAFKITHAITVGVIVTGVVLLAGWWLFIVPLWMIVMVGLLSVGVISFGGRQMA